VRQLLQFNWKNARIVAIKTVENVGTLPNRDKARDSPVINA
jgi:hypothetical protein